MIHPKTHHIKVKKKFLVDFNSLIFFKNISCILLNYIFPPFFGLDKEKTSSRMNGSESSIFFSISATNSTKNMAYFSRSSFVDPEIENYLSDQMPVGSLYCSKKSTQKLGQTEWLLHISLVLILSLFLSTQTLMPMKICNWWILHTFLLIFRVYCHGIYCCYKLT